MIRTVIFFWIILTCFSIDAKSLNVSVRAQYAILINPENEAVLFQKGANEAHYPASILKIATALYLLDGVKVDLDKSIVASEGALSVIYAEDKQSDFLLYPPYLLEHDGVMMGLKAGNSYTVRTLLHGLLLASGNDAANVLAEGVAGSIDAFMEGLNQYLKKNGIVNTRLQNPSGLHHPAQLTTAADIAKIASLCFSIPYFRQIIKTSVFEISNAEKIQSTNQMLFGKRYYYPPFIGGKTGFITSSGYNYVAAAEDGGRQLIAVLLGCEKSEDRFKDAIALFEAAFRQKAESRVLFSKDSTVFKKEVLSVEETLRARIKEDLVLLCYPSEEIELRGKLIWKFSGLPILEDDEVGRLEVLGSTGKVVATTPIFAISGIKKKVNFYWILVVLGCFALFLGLFYTFKKRSKRV